MTNRFISFETKLRSSLIFCLILFVFQAYAIGAQGTNPRKEETEETHLQSIEERWGIKVVGIRLTANQYMLDFRYHVIDSQKAADLIQKQTKPYLIHQKSGTKMPVPRTRLGPLRQTGVKPIADRNYIIMFSNAGKLASRGDKVTVVIGDFKVEDIVVE